MQYLLLFIRFDYYILQYLRFKIDRHGGNTTCMQAISALLILIYIYDSLDPGDNEIASQLACQHVLLS